MEVQGDAQIYDNSASTAGALFRSGKKRSLAFHDNAAIYNNSAGQGGVAYVTKEMQVNITDKVLIANNSAEYGGVFRSLDKDATFNIVGSASLSYNYANQQGGVRACHANSCCCGRWLS